MKILVILSIFALIYESQGVCMPIWSFNCHKNENWTELTDDLLPKDALKNVHITRGPLPLVSLEQNLCKDTSIEKLWIENVGLQSTAASALAKCTDLKVFKATENELRDGLHRDTFKQNSGLEEIWMQVNKISSLKEGTFNHLTKLEVLDFGRNELEHFSASLVEGLTNLKLLALYSNNIVELDGAAIYKNVPALEYVYFNDNPLKCGDLDKLIDAFPRFPTVWVSDHADFVVKRNYKVEYHRYFACRMEENDKTTVKPSEETHKDEENEIVDEKPVKTTSE